MRILSEFFEDNQGKLSSTRLFTFVGMAVGSFVVLLGALNGNLDTEVFLVYMAASSGMYSLGKWRESVVEANKVNVGKPNVPEVSIESMGDVNVKSSDAKS